MANRLTMSLYIPCVILLYALSEYSFAGQGLVEASGCSNGISTFCCSGRNNNCKPPNLNCYCDEFCSSKGDCCDDYKSACGAGSITPSVTPPTPTERPKTVVPVTGSSCVQCCSGQNNTCKSPDNGCYCDDKCSTYKDCCMNYQTLCNGNLLPRTTTTPLPTTTTTKLTSSSASTTSSPTTTTVTTTTAVPRTTTTPLPTTTTTKLTSSSASTTSSPTTTTVTTTTAVTTTTQATTSSSTTSTTKKQLSQTTTVASVHLCANRNGEKCCGPYVNCPSQDKLCQCNQKCELFGNCCPDYKALCQGVSQY